MKRTILITGGAGFIGSHVVRLFVHKYPEDQIVNADALTYAGNLENLKDVEGKENYAFARVDITDAKALRHLFHEYQPDGIIHLAAESHVDRSISDPLAFVRTNVLGTVNLLQEAVKLWEGNMSGKHFLHVSTDEVYGSLGTDGLFSEGSQYDPHSPYAASKASSDHFVRAYAATYGLPVVVTNCSNNYGPNQFPEKLIPLCIHHILHNEPLPIYGDGGNVRDWLYVEDHARAIDVVFHEGQEGTTYNIGSFNEWKNIELVTMLCREMDKALGRADGTSERLITFVNDRQGHDFRYAMDATKINKTLGWKPSVTFKEGLARTVDWYLNHQEWLHHVASGAYREY